VDAGLGQVEILTEYQLPLTSMRVDPVLAGVHPKTGGDSYVVIELKQWSAATSFDESPRLVTVEHVRDPGCTLGCSRLKDWRTHPVST
jgi:hypothetical protein